MICIKSEIPEEINNIDREEIYKDYE